MAEERTTWLNLLTQYADNDTGSITAEALRDLVQSVRPWVQTYPPDATSDETLGFDRGHRWLDVTGPTIYECLDATATAAVWVQTYPQAGGGELTDLASTGASAGQVPKADGSGGIAWADESGGGGAAAFTDLTDAPGSYSGAGGKLVAVKGAEDGLEFVDASGGGGIAPINGVVVVQHGSNASETRPTAATVYWMGSVAPTNRQLGDLWLETGAYD